MACDFCFRTTPLVVDLYDPSLFEYMSYAKTSGAGVYESELRRLRDACSRGDLFLCANEQQWDHYLGRRRRTASRHRIAATRAPGGARRGDTAPPLTPRIWCGPACRR